MSAASLEARLASAQAQLALAEAKAALAALLVEQQQQQQQQALPPFVMPSPRLFAPSIPTSPSTPFALTSPPSTPQNQIKSRAHHRQSPSTTDSDSVGTSTPRQADLLDQVKRWKTSESGSASSTSHRDTSDDSDSRRVVRKRRAPSAMRLSGQMKGSKIHITQRRDWVISARGDKSKPLTQQVNHIPFFYHPEIDEHSQGDAIPYVQARPEWGDDQVAVRRYVSDILQHHHSTTNGPCSAEGDEVKTNDKSDKCDSKWEKNMQRDLDNNTWAPTDPLLLQPGPNWSVRMMMPDRLYVELVKTLAHPHPTVYLAQLQVTNALMYKVIYRQLFEHARYQLFWAYVDVVTPDLPLHRHRRLVPGLYRVDGTCLLDKVSLSHCKRCLPLSQVAMLLDHLHSAGTHTKDVYEHLAQQYSGVLRDAVRLFAAKCHVCTRTEPKKRNKRPPRAIVVDDVRQRYTLDLFDMMRWQETSEGEGRGARYVAHMIDPPARCGGLSRWWTSPARWCATSCVACSVRLVTPHCCTQTMAPSLPTGGWRRSAVRGARTSSTAGPTIRSRKVWWSESMVRSRAAY